jgi:hypothetical protein
MERIKDLLAPMYLGFSLSIFTEINLKQWQFYAIIIPFLIIAKATKFNQNK